MSKRAERIKEKIPILSVLSAYGYEVYGANREQQFRCDLHGDGSDEAPSARVYPETNTWFCFACGKPRDSISTVMEKEGLDFSDACKALEIKYGLDVWEYKKPKKDIFEDTYEDPSSKEILMRRVETLLKDKTSRREDYDNTLRYWEVFNMLSSVEDSKVRQWEKLYKALSS